jgi:membrane-associated protein
MEFLTLVVDIFLHVDRYLQTFLEHYGAWVYGLLFLIVFAETGLVVTPFLPGDSLLFVAGALAALGGMSLVPLILILIVAAILGDTVNYRIGQYIGVRVFSMQSRFFKREHLEYTQRFYEKHGGKTIVIARFIPIVRTFAPFVAGVGNMPYRAGRILLRQYPASEKQSVPGNHRHHYSVDLAGGDRVFAPPCAQPAP